MGGDVCIQAAWTVGIGAVFLRLDADAAGMEMAAPDILSGGTSDMELLGSCAFAGWMGSAESGRDPDGNAVFVCGCLYGDVPDSVKAVLF